MNTVRMDSKNRQPNPVDRLSGLPDFILHEIISFLPTIQESIRTCILSKRWARISGTYPVLHFCNREFSYVLDAIFFEDIDTKMQRFGRFLKDIETKNTTMQRYSKEKLRIRELTFDFEMPIELEYFTFVLEYFTSKLDEHLDIAVRNQVEKIVLMRPLYYLLPVSLFSAKSLKYLRCFLVKIPYCNTINLTSLETLILFGNGVEDCMLNRIISSCTSLKKLKLTQCTDIKSIVIPRCSRLEKLYLSDTCETVILETSSLKNIRFASYYARLDHWPVISKTGLLRNLVTLELKYSKITDEVFGELLSELISLETLKLSYCNMLRTIRISSDTLKEIHFDGYDSLLSVRIDAPGLERFIYDGWRGDPTVTFVINSLASCDLSLVVPLSDLDTEGLFLRLKKLLNGLSNCNVLKILLNSESELVWYNSSPDDNTHLGPPCDVKELMLTHLFKSSSKSYRSAFLDGLFRTCRPDIFSLVEYRNPDEPMQDIVCELEDMAKYRKYTLKHVEVIGASCSDLNVYEKLVQLRLYW